MIELYTATMVALLVVYIAAVIAEAKARQRIVADLRAQLAQARMPVPHCEEFFTVVEPLVALGLAERERHAAERVYQRCLEAAQC